MTNCPDITTNTTINISVEDAIIEMVDIYVSRWSGGVDGEIKSDERD